MGNTEPAFASQGQVETVLGSVGQYAKGEENLTAKGPEMAIEDLSLY